MNKFIELFFDFTKYFLSVLLAFLNTFQGYQRGQWILNRKVGNLSISNCSNSTASVEGNRQGEWKSWILHLEFLFKSTSGNIEIIVMSFGDERRRILIGLRESDCIGAMCVFGTPSMNNKCFHVQRHSERPNCQKEWRTLDVFFSLTFAYAAQPYSH